MRTEIVPREERLVRSLSWTKISSFLKSEKAFIDTYFVGKEFFETKEIIFGSMLGKMIELSNFTDGDMLIEECLKGFDGIVKDDPRKRQILSQAFENISQNEVLISKLDELSFDFGAIFEQEFKELIDGVCVIGYADNCTPDFKKICEFKTGKTTWTQEKVNEHGQLDLYCLMTYIKKGYLPEQVKLFWIETKDDENGAITATGEIKEFVYDVEKNRDRIFGWQEKIPRIFDDIQKLQLTWQAKKEMETKEGFDESLVTELAEIVSARKALEEKETEMKKKIEASLKENNLPGYKIEGVATIYSTQRKSWDYGDVLKNIEAEKTQTIEKIKEENKPIFDRLEEVTKSFDTILKEKKEEIETTSEPVIKESICYKF